MFRFDPRSPEWQAVRKLLESERQIAIQKLVSSGLSEAEYHQWRGRVPLIDKLLGLGNDPEAVTD